MSDLGQLLAEAEVAVERGRSGAIPDARSLAGTVRRVRRRRAVRHSVQSVAGVALVGALGVTAWLSTHRADLDPIPAVSPTESRTTSPTPTATPPPLATPPVHVGEPLPLPRGLLESSTAGWMLVTDNQTRVGTDPYDAPADAYRNRLLLVSPSGDRYPALETSVRTGLGVFWWSAGEPLVLAATTDYTQDQPVDVIGQLDLRTGDLHPWPDFPLSAMWIGGTRDGTTVWAVPPQADLRDLPAGAVPAPRNVLGPQMRMSDGGAEFHLLVREADGTQRDLGVIDDAAYATSLSPDGRWVSATGPDGRLQLVDLRSGEAASVSTVPTDRACSVGGWSGPHELLLSCGTPADLLSLDATRPATPPRLLATSEHPVADAEPLADGRVVLGLLTQEAPCDGGGDPAVLADGVISPLTTQWGPYDHSYGFQLGGGTVIADLNSCYVGHGKAGRQRTVGTDATTGAVTELSTLEGEPATEGWEHVLMGYLVGQ